MISNVQSSRRAIAAFTSKVGVTANNVANVNTDNFKKDRVTLQEGQNGGVEAYASRVNTPGFPIPQSDDGQSSTAESSNVDLAEELIESLSAQSAHGANLKSLKAQDELIGNLLDIIG